MGGSVWLIFLMIPVCIGRVEELFADVYICSGLKMGETT